MKFRIGFPPLGSEVAILRTPFEINYVDLHIKGLILGTVFLMPLGYFLWAIFWPTKEITFSFTQGPLYILGTLVATLVAHELCHALAFPGFGFSDETYAGFDPKAAVPYVTHLGPMPKLQFLLATIAPLIFITVFPFFLAFLAPGWVKWLSWFSICNLIGAAGDILMFAKLANRIPNGCHVQGEYFGPLLFEETTNK